MWTTFVIGLVVWVLFGLVIVRNIVKEITRLRFLGLPVSLELKAAYYTFGWIGVVGFFTWVGIGLYKIIQGINS